MSPYSIQKIAVIGAGNMGSGIAQKIATEGYPVILVDVDDERVARGVGIIKSVLQQGVERRLFKPDQVEAILGRVHGTSDWDELSAADLVIEAVFEDLDVKRDVFRRLGAVCRTDAILGTNTSSFYVKDLAGVTSHPERVLGLHYFFHPAKNRLVEVIGHAGTDPAAFDAAWAVQEAIGKTPIRSADAPGFVVNRYFVPWLNEAVRLLEEGVADIPTIEAAAKQGFRIGMGPFELMNVTGVAIARHAADTLGRKLHAFYAPAQRLCDQVDAGRNWELGGAGPDPARSQAVIDRLLGITFYIAAKLVDEGVASVEDTDIGARVGLRWSKGPFDLLNRTGVERGRELARAALAPYGLELPALLTAAPAGGIPIRLVAVEDRGALTGVWITRPDAMHALNPAVGKQLAGAIAIARGLGKPLVIGGSGKAFVAGADIKFFVDNLKAGTFPKIQEFTEDGHALLHALSNGAEACVARVQGLALGGGAELAIACDWIVASPKASFGFPETGIGIVPGLGGTQRLARRIGEPLAKFLVYTGQILGAKQAVEIGLADQLATFADLDAACQRQASKGAVAERTAPAAPLAASWKRVWDFFDAHSVDQILSGQADTDGDAALDKAVQRMAQKSEHALRLAERLIDAGAALPLAAGLQLELDLLQEVFGHPDALEGLSSLLESRRPAFASA